MATSVEIVFFFNIACILKNFVVFLSNRIKVLSIYLDNNTRVFTFCDGFENYVFGFSSRSVC